jgi:hypothetical protein
MLRRMVWPRGGWSASGATVLLATAVGCVPQKELSSYSGGAAPEQSGSLNPLPKDGMAGPVAPMPEVTLAPLDPALPDEDNPGDAPLEAATTPPQPTEPGATEPASGDAPPTPSPALDASDDCATVGGFTLAGSASCYVVGDTTFSWQDARSFCQAWGGDLVQIDSAEENEQLAERIVDSAWIGANDIGEEGTFLWAGGDALEYAAWGPGQPNNLDGLEDCAELRTLQDWIDVSCTDDIARRALCERPPSS